MISKYDGTHYIVRLARGDKLVESLETFSKEHGVTSAWIDMIGAVLEVELGFYNLETKSYQWRVFTGAREITGVQGNIAQSEAGKTVLHLHGTFADEQYQVIGGHVKDFVVGGTCEIIVRPFGGKLTRTNDTNTGLHLLDL